MEIFVDNSFGSSITNLLFNFIDFFAKFWETANYTFFTIPLKWLNDVIGLSSDSPFYFSDFEFSFISCVTTGLIVVLLIHAIKLFIK